MTDYVYQNELTHALASMVGAASIFAAVSASALPLVAVSTHNQNQAAPWCTPCQEHVFAMGDHHSANHKP